MEWTMDFTNYSGNRNVGVGGQPQGHNKNEGALGDLRLIRDHLPLAAVQNQQIQNPHNRMGQGQGSSTASGGSSSEEGQYLFGGRYQINRHKRLGQGTYGVIYEALCLQTFEMVVVKMENTSNRITTLENESMILKRLQKAPGIPAFKDLICEQNSRGLAMEQLGPSLQQLFDFHGNYFSQKTILMLADQLLTRLEHIHSRNIIHRDIKPQNILMGIGENVKTVYMVDFGLSKMYRQSSTLLHIPFRVNRGRIVGTARYFSLNCHMGAEVSRRDDLESLAYVLIYFSKRGKLPWQDLLKEPKSRCKIKNKNKQQRHIEIIKIKKMQTSTMTLCEGIHPVFRMFLEYSRGLRFEEAPDYSLLHQMFRRAMRELGYVNDSIFDWMQQENYNNRLVPNIPRSPPFIPIPTHEFFDIPTSFLLRSRTPPKRQDPNSTVETEDVWAAYRVPNLVNTPAQAPLTLNQANRNLNQDTPTNSNSPCSPSCDCRDQRVPTGRVGGRFLPNSEKETQINPYDAGWENGENFRIMFPHNDNRPFQRVAVHVGRPFSKNWGNV